MRRFILAVALLVPFQAFGFYVVPAMLEGAEGEELDLTFYVEPEEWRNDIPDELQSCKDIVDPNTTWSISFVINQSGGTATYGTDYDILVNDAPFPQNVTLYSCINTVDPPAGDLPLTFVAVRLNDDELEEGLETADLQFTDTRDQSLLAELHIEIEDTDGEGPGPEPDPEFTINEGLNDAWYNIATPGQGFFITVLPDEGTVFLAWFTFEIQRPPQNIEADLGEPGHRWLTAYGPYEGNTAELVIELTSGGVFDSALPAVMQVNDGTITLEFAGCDDAMVTYDIDSVDAQGEIPITRLGGDNIDRCEELL